MATKRSLATLRSPRASDLAIAAVLFGWSLAAGVGEPLPGVLGAVLMCAPIAVRRSWPLPGTVAVGAGFVIGALQDDPPETLASLVTLLVAYALLGNATPDRRQAIAGAGIAVLCGVANTALVGDADYFFITALTVAAWSGGWLVGDRSRRANSAERRADDAAREERERIARELHDSVAHAVSLMVVQSGAAQQVLRRDPERAEQALERVQQTGRDSVADLQRVLRLLRADPTSANGHRTLGDVDRLAAGFREAGLDVAVEVAGDPRSLAAGVDLAAYRILQEALTNVLRHAPGARARIRVEYRSDEVVLEVEDEGCGRPSPVLPGHGLIGMRERAGIFGGILDAEPHDDGFRVRAVLPAP